MSKVRYCPNCGSWVDRSICFDCMRSPSEMPKTLVSDGGRKLDDHEAEALISEYKELRSEVRLMQELQSDRMARGVAALGILVGYSLLSGIYLPIALTPVVLGLVYHSNMGSRRNVDFLATRMVEIEDRLNNLINWETKYGSLHPHSERNNLVGLEDFPMAKYFVKPFYFIPRMDEDDHYYNIQRGLMFSMFVIAVIISVGVVIYRVDDFYRIIPSTSNDIPPILHDTISAFAIVSGFIFIAIMIHVHNIRRKYTQGLRKKVQ